MKINDIFVLTFNCKDLTLEYVSTEEENSGYNIDASHFDCPIYLCGLTGK